MFFKKQAFKIKDLLKEKGVELPLVTVQEILAKSYGFNNRHVILSNDNFNENLDRLNNTNSVKVDTKKENINNITLFEDFPYELSKENLVNYHFYLTLETGEILSTEDLKKWNFGSKEKHPSFFVYNFKEKRIEYIRYFYSPLDNSYKKMDTIKSFLYFNREYTYYKFFKEFKVSKEEFVDLLRVTSEWNLQKKIILHKDFPVELMKPFIESKDFYIRITAIFGKHHRDKLYYLAKKDKDARVRKVYYTYLLQNEVKSIDEIRKELKEDDFKVQKLLRHVRYLVDEEKDKWEYLVNW